MNRLLLIPTATVALTLIVTGSFFLPSPVTAQATSPSKQTSRVHITKGPALESAHGDWAIITWTSNNPGGSDEHFGVVHYGTDPKNLSQTAKSHIRLNPAHSYTVFRVRVDGLTPKTTYYYTVDSVNARSASDGVTSPVKTFTTE
jgi:phosphodiesterase/alkaline phosphatase D-like protein